MLCDEVKDRLYEFIYDELTNEKTSELKEHINHCSSCKREYEGLKHLLIDDMRDFIDLSARIQIPEELSPKIADVIRSRAVNKLSRYAVAVCMMFILIWGIPVAAQYIIQGSLLDKYKQLDPDIALKYSNYKGEMIGKSSTMKDITFTVDAIINKKDSTTILFTVKGAKNAVTNYAMPILDNGVITIEDVLGIKYRHMSSGMTLQSVNEDGEIKGILDVEPLKFYVSSLTVRITAMEVGNMTKLTKDVELQYDVKKKSVIYGKWQVVFGVHKS